MEELLIEPALSGINSVQTVSQRIADQLALERAVAESRAAARADVTAKTRQAELNGDAPGGQTGASLLARPQALFIGDAQAGDVKQGQVRAQAQQTLTDAARATGIEPRAALADTMTALKDPAIRDIAADIATASQRTAQTLAEADADAVVLDDTAPVDADDTAATVSTQQPVQAVAGDDASRTITSGDGVETDTTDAVLQSQATPGDDSADTGTGEPFPDVLVALPLGLGDPTATPADQTAAAAAPRPAANPTAPPPLVDLPLTNGPAFPTGASRPATTEAVAVVDVAAPDTETAEPDRAAATVEVAAGTARPSPQPLIQLPLTNGPAFKPLDDPKDVFLQPQKVDRQDRLTADDMAALALRHADDTDDRDTDATRRDADTDDNPLIELPLRIDLTEPAGSGDAAAASAAIGAAAADPLVELPLTNGPAFKVAAPEEVFLQSSIKASLGYAGKTISAGTPAAGLPARTESATVAPGQSVPVATGMTDARPASDAAPAGPAPAGDAEPKDDTEIGGSVRGPLAAAAAMLLNEYDPQAAASPRIPAGGLTASLNKLSAEGIALGNTITDAG